jgi:uncharacterized protein (DUF1330 family)
MPGYIMMHAEVTDPEEYEQFKVAATKAVEDHGGRFLVRGGASTALEGDFGSRVVLLEFPSYEDALAFYRSKAYLRRTGSRGRFGCDAPRRVSWPWMACQVDAGHLASATRRGTRGPAT